MGAQEAPPPRHGLRSRSTTRRSRSRFREDDGAPASARMTAGVTDSGNDTPDPSGKEGPGGPAAATGRQKAERQTRLEGPL